MEQMGWKLVMCGGVFSTERCAPPTPVTTPDREEADAATATAPTGTQRTLVGATR